MCENTKLAIMPILPTLCVCEKLEWWHVVKTPPPVGKSLNIKVILSQENSNLLLLFMRWMYWLFLHLCFQIRFRFCHTILSSLPAKMCQSLQSLLIAHSVHERIFTSTFRWLAPKKWYGKPVTYVLPDHRWKPHQISWFPRNYTDFLNFAQDSSYYIISVAKSMNFDVKTIHFLNDLPCLKITNDRIIINFDVGFLSSSSILKFHQTRI